MCLTELPSSFGDRGQAACLALFYIGGIFMLKPPQSYKEQVTNLELHKLTIDNKDAAEKFLRIVNYYRFTGYALQYRESPNCSDYVTGTHFDSIKNAYLLDEEIRHLLLTYIDKVELVYRTRISYEFSISKCACPPHDQHYDRKNFYRKEQHDDFVEKIKKQKLYGQENLFVPHHLRKYDGKMPLWVIVEVITFSDLSKLYALMYRNEQKRIAGYTRLPPDVLQNHLHCLSNLRNKCAHGSRLFNISFSLPIKLGSPLLQKYPDLRNDSLFAYILILITQQPTNAEKTDLKDKLVSIINKYADLVNLECAGFPENYIEIINYHLTRK